MKVYELSVKLKAIEFAGKDLLEIFRMVIAKCLYVNVVWRIVKGGSTVPVARWCKLAKRILINTTSQLKEIFFDRRT